MKNKKIFRTIALFALVLITGAGIYAYKEYNRKNDILTNAKPDYTKSPGELINEFTANEKQANAMYLDKVILLSGNIKTVEKDDKGFYTVSFGDINSMSSVRCNIDSTSIPDAAVLQTSTFVKVKGVCTGFNADEMGLGSDVILNRCIIVKQ